MKKIFGRLSGSLDLSWPKLIAAAVLAAVYTAAIALIPGLQYTSFHSICVTLEVWILFGILIILNSKSNLDSALKCFVFFLISQPLIYLLQVPFNVYGWGIFGYYRNWFIWTVLCFPMGYIGYYMKKDKWWGYLILFPMILLTAYCYRTYFEDFLFAAPRYLLICLFCILAMIFYPVSIFKDRKIKVAGALIGALVSIAVTVFCLLHPPVYSFEALLAGSKYQFDDSYKAYLTEDKYGEAKIIYLDSLENYAVHVDLKKAGQTTLVLESPAGEKMEFDLNAERDWYEITRK